MVVHTVYSGVGMVLTCAGSAQTTTVRCSAIRCQILTSLNTNNLETFEKQNLLQALTRHAAPAPEAVIKAF